MAGMWVANLLIIALIAGIAYFVKMNGVEFAAGVIVGTAVYNIAHRLHYGRWF